MNLKRTELCNARRGENMKDEYYYFRRVYVVKGMEHIWLYTNKPDHKCHGYKIAKIHRRFQAYKKVLEMWRRTWQKKLGKRISPFCPKPGRPNAYS